MKKLSITLIIILASTMSYRMSFATNYSVSAATEDLIFCPERIDCAEENNLGSCKAVGGDLQYWGNIRENGRVEKGTYMFTSVASTYQSPAPLYSSCVYQKVNELGVYKTVGMGTKAEANYLEAYHDKTTNWTVFGYSAICTSTRETCPLTRTAILGIKNFVHIVVDGVTLPYGDGVWDDNHQRMLSYEEALKYCTSKNKKFCTFNFQGWKLGVGAFDIGNVVVDMDNKMKISKINLIPSTGYEIKQLDGLNTVEVINKNPEI